MSHVFLDACRGLPVPYTPIWIMRQAGRYLPEYQAVREGRSFWELCETPELAAEVTLQPIRRLGVDAAILFSDILVPLRAMGASIDMVEERGPVIHTPLRSEGDLRLLHVPDPDEEIPFVPAAIRLILEGLGGKTPLIGFAGAPFTLATYLIEGGASKEHIGTKRLMLAEPDLWRSLMNQLTETTIRYLQCQVRAGVHALQLFDSWAGALSQDDYRMYVLPWTARILAELRKSGVPVIFFAVNSGHLLPAFASLNCDVIGLDWRTPIDQGRSVVGMNHAVQGNLEPAVLLSNPTMIRSRAKEVLDRNSGIVGHIFNLGHGIDRRTPPDHAKILVDAVHEYQVR